MRIFTLRVRVECDDSDVEDELTESHWSDIETDLVTMVRDLCFGTVYVDVEDTCDRECCGDGCCCSCDGETEAETTPYVDNVEVIANDTGPLVIGAGIVVEPDGSSRFTPVAHP